MLRKDGVTNAATTPEDNQADFGPVFAPPDYRGAFPSQGRSEPVIRPNRHNLNVTDWMGRAVEY